MEEIGIVVPEKVTSHISRLFAWLLAHSLPRLVYITCYILKIKHIIRISIVSNRKDDCMSQISGLCVLFI
jgi:hypothetical protein